MTTDEAWEKVRARIQKKPEAKIRHFTFLKVAASIAIVLVSIFVLAFYAGRVELSTAQQQVKNHELPDGSVVTLNANSNIKYNTYLWFLDRSVEMSGEAFYEVQKGETFSVLTRSGQVAVLGTKFNVSQREASFHVACFEGRVSVSDANGKSGKILTQGLATRLDNNKLTEPFDFNKEKLSAWKKGLFFFEKENLEEVFAEIEAYYGKEIRYEKGIEGKKFSGVFNKGELKNVLEIVCSSMGLSYEIRDSEVIVTP